MLSVRQWHRLAQLGLKDARDVASPAVEMQALTDDDVCLDILRQIQPEIGAPDLKVTASLVIKRVAFLTLAPLLYSMSVYHQGLDMSIQNCMFEYPLENRIWRSQMPLKNLRVSAPAQDRARWRTALLTRAFEGNLSMLVLQLHRLTRVQQSVLWENIAVRIFSIYERRILPDIKQPAATTQALGDLSFLLNPETTDLFGTARNPVARYFSDKTIVPGLPEPVRVRRTCCYYYRATKPAQYCNNCPLSCKKAMKKAL
ncbi:IucA/IucC family C-terminal-domain containing protein [Vibrio aerogenes]|uniref:IucA/IucC family C-terminal-domain containing protein n=1 Tax=Vibrio aerogenes TaxID=92172 RepID=UPI0021C27D36|nr:IucA/IucC family C-terminal-domain containing protein [Vibrio aerogenes]